MLMVCFVWLYILQDIKLCACVTGLPEPLTVMVMQRRIPLVAQNLARVTNYEEPHQ